MPPRVRVREGEKRTSLSLFLFFFLNKIKTKATDIFFEFSRRIFEEEKFIECATWWKYLRRFECLLGEFNFYIYFGGVKKGFLLLLILLESFDEIVTKLLLEFKNDTQLAWKIIEYILYIKIISHWTFLLLRLFNDSHVLLMNDWHRYYNKYIVFLKK